MSTIIEDLKYKLYKRKQEILLQYGTKKGLVRTYDDELITNLRHIYYGGIPASILLLHRKLSDGHCFDRGTLITLGFGTDEFQTVLADINNLKLKPRYIDEYRNGTLSENYGIHCFAERKEKDGKIWVYDTSMGLIIEKNLYYQIENPQTKKINSKNQVLDFLYHDFVRDCDIDKDKYALPLIIPNIESCLIPTQPFYMDLLKQEIEILKRELNYEGICKEIEEDMKAKGFRI